MSVTVAALYVQKDGAYFGLPDVDPWDEARDATRYDGPHPVVAHPPCARWCRLAGLVEARWGHKRGEDGGMFASSTRPRSLERMRSILPWSASMMKPPNDGGSFFSAMVSFLSAVGSTRPP